jgi:hypothetical protein
MPQLLMGPKVARNHPKYRHSLPTVFTCGGSTCHVLEAVWFSLVLLDLVLILAEA